MNMQKAHRVIAATLLLGMTGVAAAAQEPPDRRALFDVPDLEALPAAVEVVSEKTEDGVKVTGMYLAGAPFNGKPTRVFGYYCRPEKEGKYPAVIEIHGAGFGGSAVTPAAGIAYAKQGFACFVMDWAGATDKRREMGWPHSEFSTTGNLAAALPGQEKKPWPHIFKIAEPGENGIVNGVRMARRVGMFLRSRPEVDPDQLCVSGMSAGAHLTLLLIGVDPTVRAAAVKYGCGFIDDLYFGGYFGPLTLAPKEEQERWLAVLDPKHGLRDYRAGTLMLSGTDDRFFWMPVVLQTWRAMPGEKSLIMRPNDDHSLVNNVDIPAAWFRSVLGIDAAWPTIDPLAASVSDGKATLRVKADSKPGIERVDMIFKRLPAGVFKWGRDQDPAKTAQWEVRPAVLEGDTWTLAVAAPGENEQLVAYATAYDKLGREVSSDTVELPDYPAWRGITYEPWEKVFPAADYQRCRLADPARESDVKAAGNLRGLKKDAQGEPVKGWFEYDIRVPFSGWYELIVPAGSDTEYLIDGQQAYGIGPGDKVGNFHLGRGVHTLRIQRNHWSGLRPIEGFTLRAVPPEKTAGHVRVTTEQNRPVRRLGEEVRLQVRSGRLPAPAKLTAELVVAGEVVSSGSVELSDWPSDEVRVVPLACSRAGEGLIRFKIDGQEVDAGDLRPIRVDIFDTTFQPANGGRIERTLVQEIDCATTPPDFSNGGTRVVDKPFGAYRESGGTGWLKHMNATDPEWFAYTLTVPEIQVPYIIEVDYPDDALRTFCIAVREGVPGAYPSAGGVDSGGEWELSNRMLTHSLIYWPRSTDLRLVLMPALDGRRAAAAKIRVYRIDGDLPLLAQPRQGGRHFANWYEEGSNFRGVFGGSKIRGPQAADDLTLADRWARTMRHMGADTLWMTSVVYQFGLYPSSHNVEFNTPFSDDLVGKVLLACERYGMGFIGEFHPEARELNWPVNADPEDRHRATNRNGMFRTRNNEPLYNPLWPANREWLLGMIGEFVDRYAESPALRGVCLRTMTWTNSGLSNFHNLDWGYDDYTIGRFVEDTGTRIPVAADDPERFRKRYDWLLANARDAWLDWRCDQIAELYRQAVARVRQARPDLVVITGISLEDDPREGGLDPAKLAAIDGLVLLDSRLSYGRRSADEIVIQANRDLLLDPAQLRQAMPDQDRRAAFLYGAGYFEATGEVLLPEDLGFPAETPRTWMSGVVNPAGRHALERWAVTLAETDTGLLADGGNAYTIGQPVLREFLADYRALPDLPFEPHKEARDPVAVWSRPIKGEADTADGLYFYAVNRERYPVGVTIALSRAPEVTRLSSGQVLPVAGGQLVLQLQPYELQAFRAPADAAIGGVTTEVPQTARDHATALVEFLEQTATAAQADTLGAPLRDGDVALLAERAATARQALDQGRFWRARTMVENHQLRRLYERIKRQPPNLRQNGNPVAPKDALLADTLVKRLTQGSGRLVPSQELAPYWAGEQVLVSNDEVLEFTLDTPVDALYGISIGRVAGGDCGDIELSVDGEVAGVLRDPGAVRGVVSQLPGTVLLRHGKTRLQLRRLDGKTMAIGFIELNPTYTDITAEYWLAAGPFMAGDSTMPGAKMALAVDQAMKAPAWQMVETTRDLDATVTLPDGKTTKWIRPEASGTGDFIDLGRTYDRNFGCISYAVTHIHSPAPARIRISYGMDYWVKIWLNGKLVQDIAPHGGHPFKGQFSLDVDLQEGWNELLVKVGSGSLGNGFWLAVSDPGDLTFSARPSDDQAGSMTSRKQDK